MPTIYIYIYIYIHEEIIGDQIIVLSMDDWIIRSFLVRGSHVSSHQDAPKSFRAQRSD